MSFSPFDLSVKEIFSGERRYEIPTFQRDYSWEKKNFDDFYYDLVKSSQLSFDEPIENIENKYFFGMILLLGDKSCPDIKNPYTVIDGQQRLTTMTLFFAAVETIIKETKPDYSINLRERFIFEHTKLGKTEQLTRLVNNRLLPILPCRILNIKRSDNLEGCLGIESPEQNWLLESFNYLKKLLSKDSIAKSFDFDKDKMDDNKYIQILDGLAKHLENATLICIYHTNSLEANNLFRNLNYRGKALTQADLIKNELFSLLEDENSYGSFLWNAIENNINSSNESLQRFIFHFMSGRYESVTNSNIFEKFLKNITNSKDSYNQFLLSLKQASDYYRIIINPSDNETVFGVNRYFKTDNNMLIKRFLEFFGKIEISQCRNILITLCICREMEILSNKNLIQFIKIIALHQSLHVLVKSSANKLTNIYASTSRKLLGLANINRTSIKSEVRKILKDLQLDLNDRLPEIDLVQKKDLHYSVKRSGEASSSDNKERALITFILQVLSVSKQDKNTQKGNDGLRFIYEATLEHIIDREEKVDNGLSLGNIILLERSIHNNPKTIKQKKKMYMKSNITMTKNFGANQLESFNPSKILPRKKRILKEFYSKVKNYKI